MPPPNSTTTLEGGRIWSPASGKTVCHNKSRHGSSPSLTDSSKWLTQPFSSRQLTRKQGAGGRDGANLEPLTPYPGGSIGQLGPIFLSLPKQPHPQGPASKHASLGGGFPHPNHTTIRSPLRVRFPPFRRVVSAMCVSTAIFSLRRGNAPG